MHCFYHYFTAPLHIQGNCPCTKSIRFDHKQNNQPLHSSLEVYIPQSSGFRTSLISHFNISFSNSWLVAMHQLLPPLSYYVADHSQLSQATSFTEYCWMLLCIAVPLNAIVHCSTVECYCALQYRWMLSCITVWGTQPVMKWILPSLKKLISMFFFLSIYNRLFFFNSLEPNEVFYNEKFPMVMLFLLGPIHPKH